ncbi:MAG: c-type cytochrome [Deltaproteobacteria bacterium]|nr:c-type cytochrome [Deltaproteobacteria bacterium]
MQAPDPPRRSRWRWLPGWATIPIERRSYRRVFFFCSGLLTVATLWTVIDESLVRRPWKNFQAEFNRLERAKARAELQEAQKKFAEERRAEVQQLAASLRQAEQALQGAPYTAAVAALDRASLELEDITQERQFAKSELDEAYYFYEKALKERGQAGARAEKARVDRLEKFIAALDPKIEAATRRRDQGKEAVERFTKPVNELRDKIEQARSEIHRLEAYLGAIDKRQLEIRQVVLREADRNKFEEPVMRVDRCETCHLAIEKPGFEQAKQPFRTHPMREALLGLHPTNQFGCTTCHQGQGHALGVKEAHGEVEFWETPLLRGRFVEAGCRKCHAQEHQLNVVLTTTDGLSLAQRMDKPVKMPTPAGDGQAAAPKEMKISLLPLATRLTMGRELFERLGCHGCHAAKGFEDLEKVGPDLTRIKAKVSPEWIVRWLKDPKAYLPHGRMPNFGFSDGEVRAVAAYLLASSQPWRPPETSHGGGSAERGKQLFDSLGCRACHSLREVDRKEPERAQQQAEREQRQVIRRDFAPDLSRVATKVDPHWLYAWIRNPKGYNLRTAMPNLRLSEQEARDLVAFLMSLASPAAVPALAAEPASPDLVKQGEAIIGKRGCFGCHAIKGFEKAQRIAPELSNFANKRLRELFFGHAFQIKETWLDWTVNKLRNPQIYATEQVAQIMPNFRLSDEEIGALVLLLKSFKDEKVAPRLVKALSEGEQAIVEGRRLVRRYNCTGCHILEGGGGEVLAFYPEKAFGPPPLHLGPPPLLSEGEKVQADWLFSFLKGPSPIRPWLTVRMPTFQLTDEETSRLVQYFLALSDMPLKLESPESMTMAAETKRAAEVLVSKDYFNCFTCHVQGQKKPEGPPEGWAPDLVLAKTRLRPEWIARWLQNPQLVQPGTKMPSFFPGGPSDILGGNDQRQITALTEYLMTLPGGAQPTAVARRRR